MFAVCWRYSFGIKAEIIYEINKIAYSVYCFFRPRCRHQSFAYNAWFGSISIVHLFFLLRILYIYNRCKSSQPNILLHQITSNCRRYQSRRNLHLFDSIMGAIMTKRRLSDDSDCLTKRKRFSVLHHSHGKWLALSKWNHFLQLLDRREKDRAVNITKEGRVKRVVVVKMSSMICSFFVELERMRDVSDMIIAFLFIFSSFRLCVVRLRRSLHSIVHIVLYDKLLYFEM